MSAVPHATRVDLDVTGMTCAACAARIEKRLNRLEGVDATVNFATERATVALAPRAVGSGVGVDELIGAIRAAGYDASVPAVGSGRDNETRPDRRMPIVLALAAPVLVFAMVPPLQFDFWQWVSLALTSVVVGWGGWPLHRAAARNLRHATATMDTLISVGTIAALGWSVRAMVFGDAGDPGMRMPFELGFERGGASHDVYLEVAAGVTAFILVGRHLEHRARRRSGEALRALLALGAKEASVLRDGVEVRVPIEKLEVGDRFVVRPGERIATDGEVEDGASAVDASMMTGESVPVEVAPGDTVTGGTVNAGGRLVVRATRVGADTALARMAALVTEAQSGKAAVQRLADRVAAVFVPTVLAIAVATLGYWLGRGEPAAEAFGAAVAVLIVACPCALGLATPTALLVGTGRGAQLGILIRGPEVLESTRRVDTIVLDKTGTLTEGRMAVRGVTVDGDVAEDVALARVAAVETASEHPVGQAIVRHAAAAGIAAPVVTGFASRKGFGVTGSVDGTMVVAGRREFVRELGLDLSPALAAAVDAAEESGATTVVAGWDGVAHAVFSIGDTVREDAAEAVERLRALGLRPVLVTGDNASAAREVATAVGIDDVLAGAVPEDKVAVVRRLQQDGGGVAMVGDGVNDAAALAVADLGIAMGSATDAAIESSDLTLVRGDIGAAADAIRLARATLRTIRVNLFWAFAYNVAGIPLAAAGLLDPLVAGAAMACSSVFVVTNSLRLRRFRPASRT